jgi:CPA1 family monovalent cation:H+ antiporter
MDVISLVLMMLLLVVVSGFLVRILPRPVPLPLVQISLGALMAAFMDFQVELEPDIFFLLFLPPLLFLDGWRIPKIGLLRDRGTILELSLGLVLLTVVGMGFFIHWMIPAMPLAVAFALAAVVSPTDPVAVSAIASRVPIPKRIMHILEGESLLNDASGLVCLRFAVAAALTGTFSLPDAALTFLWLAIGGISVGVVLTLGVATAKTWLARRLGEESGTQILISILIPFGAYILAEHLHCSGILAAVSAGVTMSYVERTGSALASTRVRRNAVWDTIQFAANGVVFVLLGQQFPGLFDGAATVVREAGHRDEWWLVIYVFAITFGLALLRFAWVWVSVRFTMLRASWRGQQTQKTHWRIIAAMSVAGVRGAITLAGVLTLPLVMNDGTDFPARDLAIFLAAGVIIFSLILASVALPRLVNGLEFPEDTHDAEEDMVRDASVQAGIRAIEKTRNLMVGAGEDADLYAVAATRVMSLYRQQSAEGPRLEEDKNYIRKMEVVERKLHLAGLRARRDEIFRLSRTGKVEDDIMRKLVREIDLMESRYET